MSYLEYLDLFEKAQKTDCPFVAYCIDVKNSKIVLNDADTYILHANFIDTLTTNLIPYLRKDKNNALYYYHLKNKNERNNYNPIIIGDSACYFFNKKDISKELFITIVKNCMAKCNYYFDLHFNYANYETDNIQEANNKLYKGYMPRLLELKKNNFEIISIKAHEKNI